MLKAQPCWQAAVLNQAERCELRAQALKAAATRKLGHILSAPPQAASLGVELWLPAMHSTAYSFLAMEPAAPC